MAVLLLGGVVLVWAFSPGERRRREVMERVQLGDDAQRVVQLLGAEPTECPVGSLAHLRSSFPEGWPTAAVDVALQRMSTETARRWVYPVDARRRGRCEGDEGATEIGVSRDGRVAWYLTFAGKTQIRLPEDYAPAGADGAP